MKTRAQLLNHEISHEEYYNQFINEKFVSLVASSIGAEKLLNSIDEHLNDIPLKYWDNIQSPSETKEKMKLAGDYLTLSGSVCIAKNAAKQFIKNTKKL